MSIFYVRKNGTDAADGTTPATAWLTISKALGATGISSGDTVYIGSGVYRELITVSMTSATAETFVIGDVLGVYTGDEPGEVRLTNYMTDDVTAPTDQEVLNINGRDYLTFEHLVFLSTITATTNLPMVKATTQSSTNITIRDCSFFLNELSGNGTCWAIRILLGAGVTANILIERCLFYTTGCGSSIYTSVQAGGAGPDYDIGVIVRNCVFIGDTVIDAISLAGSALYKPGGMIVRNCSIFYAGMGVSAGSDCSTSIPSLAYNNLILHSGFNGSALSSLISGALISNHNLIYSSFPYDNVSAGAADVSDGSRAPLFHTGQETQRGAENRPFGMPTSSSPWLAFGNDAGAPDVDFLNRPRPSGLNGDVSMNAVGAYERHDTAREETTIYDSAPACQAIDGPGDHDFEIPVLAEETVITIKVLYDDAHGVTNKPQVQLLANPAIGYAGETVTSDGMPNGWALLEFAAFTPTDRGVVTLRCISRAESGSGVAYFDTITVNGA
jgi:hypothetical protein